jgi:orotate phosphoribosyltransferase
MEKEIAKLLLQINAIKLEPTNYFTWASGLKSPIYCDNRKTLSYPEARDVIKNAFVKVILEKYGKPDVIAGVATGAIAIGVLIAEVLGLPFVYVRASVKKHGMGNLIEGEFKKGQSVVVIEDLISTGMSSLRAVNALREAGAEIKGMAAIFTYGFMKSAKAFDKEDVKLFTLSNYNALINLALESGYIKKENLETLAQWRDKPEIWMQ